MANKRLRKMLRWSRRHTAAAIAISLFSFSSVATIGIASFLGAPAPDGAQFVAAPPNATRGEIVEKLHAQGYGTNKWFLKAALAVAGLFKKIEAGGYYITAAMDDWDLFRSLANPRMRYITINEGLRKEEIADHLAKRLEWDVIEKREFVNMHLNFGAPDLEGKFFPDTYLIPADADPEQVAVTMIENYEEKIAKLEKKYPKTIVNHDTALLIASIIQREAAGKGDMRLISGIIWNRIFKGMSLSMDATIQYARGKTEDGWWAPIAASDIRTIDSPYNTYKQNGLPPTPISNPGFDALEAALNPQKTNCYFYLHDKRGRIHCSPTGEGHEQNVRTYLR